MSNKNKTEITEVTEAAYRQISDTAHNVKTNGEQKTLRADVYDLLYELCLAVKFKRMELDWISHWDICDAGNEWGTRFQNERLSFALIQFMMETYIAGQSVVIDSTLIEAQRNGRFVLYRFIPMMVKDLNVKWADAVNVVPGAKSEPKAA